ncbi:macrophage mannose receptor 1-like [Tachysurus fulvidraco]|uniref:macrophage mannose receptor 1-like n=1 Tax=Tachysurus fulvidraco TaxID=1234273 RepID=UPI001FEF519E|nr:macrophage mannose receptor 1-like [Tachysurus fulvidraco]
MKLNLFLLRLTGLISITLQYVRHDYLLIKTPMTWANAKTYCEKKNQSLAVVKTADDWNRLTAEAERHGLGVTGWIGLCIEVGRWFFSSYSPVTPLQNINNWAPGQPDNFGGNQSCIAMESNGTWSDYCCSDLKPFICATTEGLINITSPALDWFGSRKYCASHYLDLASPKNVTQNNLIQPFVSPEGASWIGIFRPNWTWVNKDVGSGLPWRSGYPNNVDGNNNCGFLNNSLLEDKPCSRQLYFFCHISYTVRQQVLKLKIQGDNSVFGPASQAAILQQVKQKLKDHGVERETNVTWRVWPDGTVIHKKSKNEL